MPGDASVIRLNTPDGGLKACLTLGRVPQRLADYMTGVLGIDTLNDMISYVKFDTWEQEVESKIIAPAIVAKAVEPEKQNIALARLRTAWKAGWEAIKSSGARGADASVEWKMRVEWNMIPTASGGCHSTTATATLEEQLFQPTEPKKARVGAVDRGRVRGGRAPKTGKGD